MGKVYNAADALVMPSVTRPADGLNVCVLDAMACARPVIGTTAAGNELVIRDGVNGFIVPESDPAALAGAHPAPGRHVARSTPSHGRGRPPPGRDRVRLAAPGETVS